MAYQYKAWMKTKRICALDGCGKKFLPRSHNQKYCCQEHKMQVSRAQFKRDNPKYFAEYMKRRKLDTVRTPMELKPKRIKKRCNVDGCTRNVMPGQYFLCEFHYRHGEEGFAIPGTKRNGHYIGN